ncbi:hypothetical protein F511_10233 [Dorcoceras hygrometricum]|uniref:Delphilin-like n=1 Tax=Dorcoceras hygrometricum TaxID=472368 RepID=A0A2Z7CYW9_9LAMI|nr:hypothetical protein F511_10233 [Dorcoceras hygrometricum]
MADDGMVKMFRSLKEWIHVFLGVSNYENALQKFFENGVFMNGEIMSTIFGISGHSKEVFAKFFKLPSEGILGFSNLPAKAMAYMSETFFATGAPFRPLSKKNDMKVDYRLLNDIVAKSLTAKAGSFDAVTTERLNIMVAISTGIKVNWAHVLFTILTDWQAVLWHPIEFAVGKTGLRGSWGIRGSPSPQSVEHQVCSHLQAKNLASVKLEGATKHIGEKATGDAEPKKKTALPKSKRPVEEIPIQPAQMRPVASSDSAERPLETLAMTRPEVTLPETQEVQAHISYSWWSSSGSIPEGPEEEAAHAAQMGSIAGGEDILEAAGNADDGGRVDTKATRADDSLIRRTDLWIGVVIDIDAKGKELLEEFERPSKQSYSNKIISACNGSRADQVGVEQEKSILVQE